MKEISYRTSGSCSKQIEIKIKGDVLTALTFIGGCPGNLQAIAALAKGRRVSELIPLLEGIGCQNGTSCPDQLAKALKTALAQA